MSDGSLSQDEIDALLQGGGGSDFGAPSSGGSAAGGGGGLSQQELQAFNELLNEVVSAQSSNLSSLIGGKSVTIQPPKLEVPEEDELRSSLAENVVEVKLDYTEGLAGGHSYILEPEAATTLAGLIVGQEQVELNDMALESLKEALSTITGVALTTIGDKTGSTILPSPGDSQQTTGNEITVPENGVVKATYNVSIEGENPVEMVELFELPMVQNLLQQTGNVPSAGAQAGGGQMAQQPQAMGAGGQQGQPQQQGFMQQQQNFGGQQSAGGGQMGGQVYGGQQPPNVQSVQFPSLNQGQGSQESGNISLLMDVYMEMTVELGRTKKSIKEILGMGEGTIIELDKLAGEPVDILVNHKLIATGEVVVIDENFGVRVTEIVSPTERMKDLT
jgi:flagellar motor switch protein FliN/FliY